MLQRNGSWDVRRLSTREAGVEVRRNDGTNG